MTRISKPQLDPPIGATAPLLGAAAAFAAGTALGYFLEVPPPLARWAFLLALAVSPARRALPSPGRLPARRRGPTAARRMRWGFLVLAAGLARGASTGRDLALPAGAPGSSGPAVIAARVAEIPVLREAAPADDLRPARPARTWFQTECPRLAVAVDGDATFLRPGRRVRLSGRLSPPRTARNPGDLDRPGEPPFLHVPAPEMIEITGAGGLAAEGAWIDGIALAVRERAHRTIERLYPVRARGLMLALLLGDRRLLDPGLARDFRRTGTYHYLAISGFHAGILLAIFLRLPLPARAALPIRLGALALFALATGAAAPVVRAVLMLSLSCLASAAGRPVRPLDGFAWAVILLLAARPEWIGDTGFQLSAAAVHAILAFGRGIEAMLPGGGWAARRLAGAALDPRRPGARLAAAAGAAIGAAAGWARSSMAIAIAAALGTAPLLLYRFQAVYPLGAIWSLVIYFPMAALLLGGALSVLLGALHPALGAPLASMAGEVAEVLEAMLAALSRAPGNAVYLPRPHAALAILSLAAPVVWPLLVRLAPRAPPAVRRAALAAAVLAGAGAAAAGAIGTLRGPPGAAFELWVFDVGSGSAQLLLPPNGGAILIDAGSTDRAAGLGDRLARSLLALGVRRLDAAVLTHPDADHINAAEELLEVIPAGEVLIPPFFETFPSGRALAGRLRAAGWRVRSIARGQRLRGGGGWSLDAVHPTAAETLPLARRVNEGSLVLRLRSEIGGWEGAALLPADVEEAGTARLLSLGEDLRAGLLVHPHHGRSNRLLGELLRAAGPRQIIISGNGDGGARETAAALERSGIQVHATWRDGAARALLDPAGAWRVEAPFRITPGSGARPGRRRR